MKDDMDKVNSPDERDSVSPDDPGLRLDESDNLIIAALFALPGAMSLPEIASVLGVPEAKAREIAESLYARLKALNGALVIRRVGDKYELCVNDRYYERLMPLLHHEPEPVLTDALIETLAIIAGKGSATRVDIADIRGVSSDHAVNKLIEYGLIEERGRLPLPGRPIVFAPTDEFYRHFGIENFEEVTTGADPGDSPETDEPMREAGTEYGEDSGV